MGLAVVSVACSAFMLGLHVLPLTLATWYLARQDLAQMDAGTMDPSGEQRTKCAVYLCLLAAAITGMDASELLGGLFKKSPVDTDAAFLRSSEADLSDTAPILIYADWLEEQGMEKLAYAWRWRGRRDYRPARRTRPRARIPWAWWHVSSYEAEPDSADRLDLLCHRQAWLPVLVFRAMGHAGPHVYCKSLGEAASRLASGLRVLGELAGDP